jgi:hypothetical protein
MRYTHVRLAGVTDSAINDAASPDVLTVGAAAAHAGVTVRTLHHWDAIGREIIDANARAEGIDPDTASWS